VKIVSGSTADAHLPVCLEHPSFKLILPNYGLEALSIQARLALSFAFDCWVRRIRATHA